MTPHLRVSVHQRITGKNCSLDVGAHFIVVLSAT